MLNFNQKIIFIQHTTGSKVKISIPLQRIKQQEYTSQWLLKEAIMALKRQFPKEAATFDNIVALQTTNNKYAIDHCLCSPKNSISFLADGIILIPFYKQVKTQGGKNDDSDIASSQVTIDDFVVVTKLGYGAFSNVYLGNFYRTQILYNNYYLSFK